MGSGLNWFRIGWNCDTSVNTVTELREGRSENGRLAPGRGRDFIVFRASRLAVGATQPALKWVPGVISLPAKGLEREAHQSSSSGEVLNVRSYNSLVAYVLMVSSFIKESLKLKKTWRSNPTTRPSSRVGCSTNPTIFTTDAVYHSYNTPTATTKNRNPITNISSPRPTAW